MATTNGSQGLAAFRKTLKVQSASTNPSTPASTRKIPLRTPSKRRRVNSLTDEPYDLNTVTSPLFHQQHGSSSEKLDTVLYLAYGSNLSAETFQGKRGVRPLSQVNVVVPELVMTFDLAGLPYVEPCFANTKYRNLDQSSSLSKMSSNSAPDYHKTRWHKGLVGVVYEVTKSDYAHIIATEGGGSSYQDVLVDCYELPPNEPIVPQHPTSEPFKAHTLCSPVYPPGEKPPDENGRFSRPDPDYAQPSARYLKLITDGADEHALPAEYNAYLHNLRPYTATTQRQRVGVWIFVMIWVPFIQLVFGLNNRYADKDGKAPKWLVVLTGAIFKSVWVSYDGFFYNVFGDGERTVDADGEQEGESARAGLWQMERRRRLTLYNYDEEKVLDVQQAV